MKSFFAPIFRFLSSSPEMGAQKQSRSTGSTNPRAAGSEFIRAEHVGTPQSALAIASVYRAVELISNTVGRLPLYYQRRNAATGVYVHNAESPLFRLLALRPNERVTAFIFQKSIVQQILLLGNAYVYPRRNHMGEIFELVLLSPHSVGHDVANNVYLVNDMINGVSGNFSSSEVIHLRGVSLDGGNTGVSVLTYAARCLSITATGDRETGDRLATGGKYKMLYTQEDDGQNAFPTGFNDEDEMNASADEIEARLNSGRSVVVVPGTGKLSPLSMTSADLQFLESRKFSVAEIARFFGVPLQKMMASESGGNYKSAPLANADFHTDTIAPILTQIEQEFSSKLLITELLPTYRVKFDRSELLSFDPLTRAELDAKNLSNGTRTPNELRAEHDRTPVSGGDVPLVSTNLRSLDELSKLYQK